MDTEEKKSLYKDYLESEGFRPEIDSDGDVKFKNEGQTYFLMVYDDDAYFQLLFPNFWSIDSPDELLRAREAANFATRGTKVVKVFVRGDELNTSAAIELFLDPPDAFKLVFPRAMRALRAGVETFANRMKESMP